MSFLKKKSTVYVLAVIINFVLLEFVYKYFPEIFLILAIVFVLFIGIPFGSWAKSYRSPVILSVISGILLVVVNHAFIQQ